MGDAGPLEKGARVASGDVGAGEASAPPALGAERPAAGEPGAACRGLVWAGAGAVWACGAGAGAAGARGAGAVEVVGAWVVGAGAWVVGTGNVVAVGELVGVVVVSGEGGGGDVALSEREAVPLRVVSGVVRSGVWASTHTVT